MGYFDNLTAAEQAQFNETTLSVAHLYNIFKADIEGDSNYLSYIFNIDNKYFSGNCEITGEFEHEIEIKNCIFRNQSNIREANFNEVFSINHCYFEQDFWINEGSTFQGRFNLIEITISSHCQLYVEGGRFNICWWSIIGESSVKISGGSFSELNLGAWGDGCKLKYLSFDFRKANGFIRVLNNKSRIKSILFLHFNNVTVLEIDEIEVNNMVFYKYRNENSLRIFNLRSYECESLSEFSIIESYLGKAEFYSIDFNKFNKFNVLNSHLIDCSFVNIKWNYSINPFKGRGVAGSNDEKELENKIKIIEENKIEHFDKIEEFKKSSEIIEFYSKKRETFRQLKFALGKQGDHISEQKFHINEMLAYDKTINIESAFWTKLIIQMSSLFSDFGQSIHKPILWLLGGHLALFTILIISSDQYNFIIKHIDDTIVNSTDIGFSLEVVFYNYIYLMNPLRRAENTLPGWLIIFDILMRIWSSYMIYNLIRATRRFIK